ncbi:CRTAC1 family protein [Catalinimonas alkaloidigena]|uniref:CRTAC1 family protein n=1 Tax=Catalinimonas alkaloidigena TaxID=1075417 RepID=UPI0015A4DC06|nr:CRTAC1 family protein [Catalinimonas alkaloidigena]
MNFGRVLGLIFVLGLGGACDTDKTREKADETTTERPAQTQKFSLFTRLESSQTGIDFSNKITENDSVNLIANEYTYMGGGVGIGDFNRDGLPDVYFSASQGSARLYLNRGDLRFEDVTEQAGLTSDFWGTGVSVVDINQDGYDDIYVCASGRNNPQERKNRLYINNQNLTFSEQAEAYGLADTSFSTQATFFDYDRDGDLDLYLLNHQLYALNANTIAPRNDAQPSPASDKLYQNLGGTAHPVFREVTQAAGLRENGYGLGVVVSDFNGDAWPDLYVANDYIANDLLWINQQNGTFRNEAATALKHQSYSSMGVDAADINNDGWPDLASLDMLPADNARKKMMYSFMRYDRYELERRMGYEPTFMRNMLQLNRGVRPQKGLPEPFFSEIGQLAGVHETDWSWSVLMADWDNDGWKDLYITNGMGRDFLNNDYILNRDNIARQYQASASQEERNRAVVQKLADYGDVALKNYLFLNNKDLTFNTLEVEGDRASISNGCAYADLDNDGDLDLVVNNINQEAMVLRNNLTEEDKQQTHHFLTLHLDGPAKNPAGFGTSLRLYAGGAQQVVEQQPVRGYASSVDARLHVGLGSAAQVDSLVITWPDGAQQTLRAVAANQTLMLHHAEATTHVQKPSNSSGTLLFADVTQARKVDFKHQETFFDDYSFQWMLPQKYSQLGPFLAQGDVNGDGRMDFFAGGAYQQWGQFFLQQPNGQFVAKPLGRGEKDEEDLGCLLFDADGDGDLDLFINSGGYEYDAGSPYYQPRLYTNDGAGNFSLDRTALPRLATSAQCVAGADYDGDGDLDLFIGGRVSPNQFPVAPASYLLQNDNGHFTDITATVCPALQRPGMVTSALWLDVDQDQRPDLIIAGEWMPIRFFKNEGPQLREISSQTTLTQLNGQWRSLAAADLDGDGDQDLVAGNLGMNNKFKASLATPIRLFAKDLDQNGTLDPILSYYLPDPNGARQLYPAMGRDHFAMQVPGIRKKFNLHAAYANVRTQELFSPADRQGMLELVCEETHSVWLENQDNGVFVKHNLPVEAQFAPVNAIACEDVTGDGNLDLILAGNEYQTEIMTGRYDASYGVVLQGNGKGGFESIAPAQSGLILEGDVKDIKVINAADGRRILVVTFNDQKMRLFQLL